MDVKCACVANGRPNEQPVALFHTAKVKVQRRGIDCLSNIAKVIRFITLVGFNRFYNRRGILLIDRCSASSVSTGGYHGVAEKAAGPSRVGNASHRWFLRGGCRIAADLGGAAQQFIEEIEATVHGLDSGDE